MRNAGLRQRSELALHLVRREISATYRGALLGWAWPLVRQLAQLGVLVFVFDRVIDLDIPDYPVFVFSGLIAWSWFSAGVQDATWTVFKHRYLLFQGGFPTQILPVVNVTVRLVDFLLALPVLLVMAAATGALHSTILLLPLLVAVQLALMAGIAFFLSALTAYFRDVPNGVTLVLLLLFYVTPIFYSPDAVPDNYSWVLDYNPIAVMIEAFRDITVYGSTPDWSALALVAAASAVLCVAGHRFYCRLSRRFVDVV